MQGRMNVSFSPSDFSQSYKNNYYPLGPEATCQIHKSSEIPEWHLDFLLLSGLLFSSSTPSSYSSSSLTSCPPRFSSSSKVASGSALPSCL